MKKRLLSFALVFVMVLGMLPAQAFAAAAELTWSGNTITLASGTTVGSATLTGLLIYKQGATSTFPEITGVTQDGTTLNVTLAEDTDPSYPLQAGFTAGSYYVQNINNTCTLKNGQGTMTVSVQVKPAPAPNAPTYGSGTFTIHFTVPMGEPCAVTAPAGEGFIFTGENSAYKEKPYSFTVKAAEGYDGTDMVVKVNDEVVKGENGTYTIASVSDDLIITVEGIVKKEVCSITAPTGEGFTFTGAATVYKGDRYTFQIAVDNAYNASNMVVKAGETELTGENGTYTIEAVNEDTVITVSGIVEKTIYTVTLTEGTGYTLSGQSTSYAGEPYTFTVTVDDAVYKANEVVVKVNDEAVTLTDGKYTFAALDGDKTVTVENVVERQLFTVTKPEAEGITFTGADNVREGKPYTFSIKADQAYDVSGMVVKVNGEEITGTDGSYTLPSVSDDLTISVEGIAAKAIYHVTAPAAGKFTFTGGETVYGGDDYTFTVQANTGYTATVKVNGEDLTGSNGSYTVVAVSEDLVITVETERAPITGTEIPVTDGVIDITDRTIYSRSSYYAKATNIVVAGVSVKEAYEDGTTVSIVLPYTAADDAVVDITFGTSLNKCTMEGTTGSLTLADGEGTLNMTLTGMYISSLKSTATYTLIFIREEMPTDPPVCVKTADTAEVWKGHALEIDLRDYFTAAGTYYLVDGENKIPIEGSKYTYVPTVGGEQTLVFTAVNEFGESSERLTFTVTVKDIEGGLYIGHTTSNGSLDHVVFTDAEGNLIEGLNVALEGTTIKVSVPRSYAADGQITATFALTQKDGLPKLSTSNAFNGSNDTKVYTTTLSNGAGSRSMYFYNSHPKATSNSYTTYKIEYITQNEAPVLAPGQSAAGETTITADQTYTLDLDGIFVDPDEGDSITGWTVSINDADAVKAEVDENNVYSWETDVAGEYQLAFRALDNYNAVSGTAYTVRLMVENSTEVDSMTVSLPEGLEPAFYIATGFKDGIDQLGEEVSAQKGETADGMTAYTISYPTNVTMLSVRTEDWGGMAFDAQKDGMVSLRKMQFSVVDYDNNTAESTNTVTYGGNTAVAGTDGWLLVTGMEYVFAAVPKDASLAAVSGTATLEAGAETYIRNMMLGIKNPMTITVPAGGKAQLYKFNQYYSNTELDAKIVKDNGDGTTSYSFVADTKANGANYIYRVTMPGKITKAGWLAWGKQSLTVTYSDSDKSPDYRLDDYSGTGEASSGVAEDSVLLNINSRNHLNLSVGQSKVLKAYRAWEIIPVSYNNYIIPPDFTYTILSGNDVVSLSEKTSASAADGDWMTLTALKEGIAIIEVTYAAIKVEGGQYDGVYGASDPARAGLVVVQVGESDDPSVNFGIDSFASIGKAGSSNISYNPNNAKAWDAEFDTLYFTGDSGELKLTPTASGAITEVAVSHDKGANWTVLNGAEGTYTAKIVPGNNIIRVATASGTAYQVVRGDKIAVTLKELDGKSDSDGIVEAGETVRVTLVGLHSPIPKMAGNYNPGFGGNDDGYSSQHLNYTCNGEAIYGVGMQYNFVTAANYVDVVMPEDGSSVSLTDGYIGVGVIGLDNFVNGGDSHRNIPDNGCATRGSKSTWHTRSILPEITVTAGGESAPNAAPIVRADAVKESEIFDDQKYAINPDTLFQDTDGNVLTFTLSVNGGEAKPVGVDFKFVSEQAGVYELTFTASDGKETAQHTITLTVTARQQEEDQDDKFGLEDSEIAGYVTISVEDNAIRVEGETGLKFPAPLGTIIEPTRVPFKQGENIAQVTKRLLDHLKIGMKYSGTLESGFYLGAITNFEVDDTPYISMGEFDAGVGSGWMITQNDVFINKGASEFEVANGDILKWKYTCQLGADIGDDYATKRIENVEKLISEIGEVTLDKADEISAARAAYDELTEAQKQQVENYTTLTAAETALADLKAAAAADQAAADAVEAKIAAIGIVTLTSENAITEARDAYNALTDAQKALVENLGTLTDAETALAELKAEDAANRAAAANVEVKIATIGEVSLAKEDKINAARTAYDALTDVQKTLVTNYETLTAAETALAELKAGAATDQAAANAVKEMIAAIGEVTLESETVIAEARAAYDALTEERKALVENYETLMAAEAVLAELKAAAAGNQAAANAVKEQIAAIGEVTLESEAAITEARAAYDALTDAQKDLVDNYVFLTAAEATLNALKTAAAADRAAANAVEEKIAAIGEVSLAKENKITEARTAYDALTEARKALVENYETLTAAETALADLKAATAADQAAADAVEAKIAAIGTVTLTSENAITEARDAYNALTDAQKALVENYQTLTAAEDALTALKSAGLDEMYEAAAETLLTQTPVTGSTGGEWLVFGLSRALDKELTAAQKTAYEAAVQALLNSELNDSGQLNQNKPTENARVALALTALGYDPANYNGKNLLSALEDTAWTAKQGNNSAAFALLAFNAADYHASNEDTLIQSLLANQLSTGGWNINSGIADADTTAMVVQALAPYYQSNPNVKTAVDNALVYLKGLMNTKGQLNNGVDEPSVETVSQMIVALCELGIDPATWKTENDVNLLHGLASFYVDGSKKGFAHTGDNTYNQMATEQAFYTMVAYKRFLNKDATSLYDMSDARVQKYTITVSDSVNGTVTPSKSIAAAGETITVSVAPNNGYKLKSLSMNGAALTANESGVYSFTMPEQVVTLTAVFEKLETVIEQDTTVSNGTASAVIPDTAIDEAVAAVGGTEDKVVTIIPTETGSADKVEVSIPADSAGKIADADAALIVQAPAGAVEIPKEILTQMEGTADQTVKITVEARTQEHIADAGITADTTGAVIVEVTIQKGDTKVTDFDSNQLTITIPVTNGFVAGKTYDVIVISEGKANETVKGLCIQQGEQKVIQVKINHLSTFVVLNPVTADLVEAMDTLAVADAKKVTYEKIMAIETAYDKLTIAEKLQIRDAYKAFQDQVEMFELYLEMIVEEAAEELEDFYKDLDQDDYSTKAWKKIKEAYNDSLDALTEAHYEEEVYELLEEYLEYLEEAAAGELEVTFRLIGDWKHDDGVSGHDEYVTWIETTEYNMPAGSTIYDLFIKAIDDFDLNQKGASKNYVESIQAPDILGGYWIGEFDNGPNSGWMYTINGDHPGYGLKEQDLEDGDEVIWHYVDDYTLEERKTTSKYYERWLEADDISPEAYVKRHLDKIVTIEGKGEVKPELKMSHIGKDVKFTFTPAEGWVIKNVYVDGKDKGAIETYTYKKLAMDARIEVVFAQNVAFQMNFVDVPEAEWFYDDVYFAVSNGLFNGINEVTFAPGASMTRAMLITVLYRLEGQPAVYGGSAFADVAAGQWYTDAVIWATRNGTVNGLGNGKFGANDNVTREQMAAILYRYAQNCGYDTTARANLNGYTDAAKISAYAQEAMSWANAMDLINGRTATALAPTGTATRAEVAAIFHRFAENIAK